MKINGIKGMSVVHLQEEVANGGKFVVYTYCFSLLFISFKRTSGIYFIRSHENTFMRSMPFIMFSFLFGWWGVPCGILYTFASLFTNIQGGRDVTVEALQYLQKPTMGYVFEFESATTVT